MSVLPSFRWFVCLRAVVSVAMTVVKKAAKAMSFIDVFWSAAFEAFVAFVRFWFVSSASHRSLQFSAPPDLEAGHGVPFTMRIPVFTLV